MSEIRLDDGTINVGGEWVTGADLTGRIKEKMQAGDMKFAHLASALEELNTALENSQSLTVRLVITRDDYRKLKAFGGSDDRKSVRKSIMAFLGLRRTPVRRPPIRKKWVPLNALNACRR